MGPYFSAFILRLNDLNSSHDLMEKVRVPQFKRILVPHIAIYRRFRQWRKALLRDKVDDVIAPATDAIAHMVARVGNRNQSPLPFD